jgi:hypothetical protein
MRVAESTIRNVTRSFAIDVTLPPRKNSPYVNRDNGSIYSEVSDNLFLTLHKRSCDEIISLTAALSIRIRHGVHRDKTVPYWAQPQTQTAREMFCISQRNNPSPLPVIFSDKFMVCANITKGSVWRHRGVNPLEEFYLSDAHHVGIVI